MANDDDDEARRKQAAREHDTLQRIDRLLAGLPVEPRLADRAFRNFMDAFTREAAARAEVLAQAIELATPAIEARMQPVLAYCAGRSRVESVPPDAAWLQRKATCLRMSHAFMSSIDPTLGDAPAMGDLILLLDDGRLAEVSLTSRWHEGVQYVTIVRAQRVEATTALLHWDFGALLGGIDTALAIEVSADAEARRERFHALVARAAGAMLVSADALEACVRPG